MESSRTQAYPKRRGRNQIQKIAVQCSTFSGYISSPSILFKKISLLSMLCWKKLPLIAKDLVDRLSIRPWVRKPTDSALHCSYLSLLLSLLLT